MKCTQGYQMNRAMPTVTEPADDLKHSFQHEHDPRKRQRLQMLYLIASRQASRRTHLARLLGRDRTTIGSWLARYERGGLSALLDLHVPQGKAPALSPDQLERLKQRLAQPTGFASYAEVQQWIRDTLGVEMGYHGVHTLLYDKLNVRLKVARPSHEKKAMMQ
jgi:transposase